MDHLIVETEMALEFAVATEIALEGKVVELEQQLAEAKSEVESENRWANLYARESQQHWDELMEAKLRIHALEQELLTLMTKVWETDSECTSDEGASDALRDLGEYAYSWLEGKKEEVSNGLA